MHYQPTIQCRQVLGWLAASVALPTGAAMAATAAHKSSKNAATATRSGAALMARVNSSTETPRWHRARVAKPYCAPRSCFPGGEIDGSFGANMCRMVAAFQSSKGQKASGRLDEASWKALTGESPAPVLMEYTLSKQDAAGPFTKTPADMMERAKLKTLDFEDLQETLGERFHCSPQWLRRANRASKFEAGDRIKVPSTGPEKAPALASSIRIDKSEHVLYLLDKAEQPVAAFQISIGGLSDPLPLGRMEIKNAAKDPGLHLRPQAAQQHQKDRFQDRHCRRSEQPGRGVLAGPVETALGHSRYTEPDPCRHV